MIEIIVSEGYGEPGSNDQIEHTKVIKRPNNMAPAWRELLTFDILRPTDEVAI